MADDEHADDDLWVDTDTDTDAEEPVELPLADRGAEAPQRSPWVLVGGVAVVVVALLAGAWVVAGRGGDDVETGSDTPAAADGFWGQRWQVEAIEGKGAPDLGAGAPDLFLDASAEGRLSFTGCNGGSGPATVESDRLVLGAEGFTSTDMACVGDDRFDLMGYDTWMQAFLASTPRIAVDGSRLTLTSGAGTVTFRQAAGPTTTIPGALPPDGSVSNDPAAVDPADPSYLPDPGTGTSVVPGPTVVPGGDGGGSVGNTGADDAVGQDWEVTGLTIDGAERTVVPDRDGGPIVLDLTQSGSIGFNGCNPTGGTVEVDGDRLVVGGLNSTKMACTGATGEALLAQDRAIASLLEAGPTASVEGGTLTLASSAGTLTASRVG